MATYPDEHPACAAHPANCTNYLVCVHVLYDAAPVRFHLPPSRPSPGVRGLGWIACDPKRHHGYADGRVVCDDCVRPYLALGN